MSFFKKDIIFGKVEDYINKNFVFFSTLNEVKVKKIEDTYITYKTRTLLLTSRYSKAKRLLINDIKNIYLKKQIYNYLRKKKLKNII